MNKEKTKINFKDESGFTLMELIVVIGIIVILIGLLVPRFSGMSDKANATSAQNNGRIALTALSAYTTSVDTIRGGRYSTIKAGQEIHKALGSDDEDLPPIGIEVTVDGNTDNVGQATITTKGGKLTYKVTIDARKGKITKVACSGDIDACTSLVKAGLATDAAA